MRGVCDNVTGILQMGSGKHPIGIIIRFLCPRPSHIVTDPPHLVYLIGARPNESLSRPTGTVPMSHCPIGVVPMAHCPIGAVPMAHCATGCVSHWVSVPLGECSLGRLVQVGECSLGRWAGAVGAGQVGRHRRCGWVSAHWGGGRYPQGPQVGASGVEGWADSHPACL